MVARVDGNSTSGGRARMGIIRSIFIERRIRYITVSFKGDGQELHGEVLEIMGLRGDKADGLPILESSFAKESNGF